MRSPILISLLVCVLTAAITSAQPQDPSTDVVGIYFDQGAMNACLFSPPPYTSLTAYVLATHLAEPTGLLGWEGGIFTEPESMPAGWTLSWACDPGPCLLSDVHVTFPAALPQAPVIQLGRLSTFYLGGPMNFAIGPADRTSFPDSPGPGFVAGDGSGRLVRLNYPWWSPPVVGHPDRRWVAGTSPYACPDLPAEPSSWTQVKELYR